MSEYERTLSMEAPADQVFAFVSDPANFTKFIPDLHTAQPGTNQSVHLKGTFEGKAYEMDGYVKTDREERFIEWNNADTDAASGSIVVEPGDVAPEFCEITLTVSKGNQAPSDTPTEEDEQILQWIDNVLHQIQHAVEPKGGSKSSFV